MADAPVPPPPPVAIRITRPYASEEEYLDEELDTLTRTSITLLGVQPRPQGVVLRFELVLSSGQVLARGEGRVIGFKHNAHEGLGGLTLRFTRLDSRTKTLVDKAAALREQRRPSARQHEAGPTPSALAPTPVSVDAAPEAMLRAFVTQEEPSEPSLMAPIAIASEPSLPDIMPAAVGAPVEPPAAEKGREPPSATESERASATESEPIAPRVDRDALLDRLRARSKRLNPGALQVILASRRRS